MDEDTIIGCAEEPTAIFMPEKSNNILERLNAFINKKRYRKNRKKIEAAIKVDPHTLSEVVHYMIAKYGAVELKSSSRGFNQMKQSMKAALIQKLRPDLIGVPLEPCSPELQEDNERREEWIMKAGDYHQRAMDVPDEAFPTDYHLYEIKLEDIGGLRIEIDLLHDMLLYTYSGYGERYDEIVKDIFLYYGVREKDRIEKNERYQLLLCALCKK